ncbi:MAG: hypothetical protein AAGE94_22630 [Acidobacteriota bacterium]
MRLIETIDYSRYVEREPRFVLTEPDSDLEIRRQAGWPASPCLAVATDRWDESQATGHDDGTIRLWELDDWQAQLRDSGA